MTGLKITNCCKGTSDPLWSFSCVQGQPQMQQAGAGVPTQCPVLTQCSLLIQPHKVQGSRKSGPCSELSVKKPNSPEFSTFYSNLHSLGKLTQGNSWWKSCSPFQLEDPPRGSISHLAPNWETEIWVRESIPARRRGLMGTLSSSLCPGLWVQKFPVFEDRTNLSVKRPRVLRWIYTHPVPAPTSTTLKLQGKSWGFVRSYFRLAKWRLTINYFLMTEHLFNEMNISYFLLKKAAPFFSINLGHSVYLKRQITAWLRGNYSGGDHLNDCTVFFDRQWLLFEHWFYLIKGWKISRVLQNKTSLPWIKKYECRVYILKNKFSPPRNVTSKEK